MKTAILILIFFIASLSSHGQNNDLPMRSAYKFTLAIDNKTFLQTEVKSSSYILREHNIQIYPGEKVFIEIEAPNGEIKSMKSVKENMHPEKTLTILFFQQTTGRENEFMYLSISNPFKRKLKYQAYIFSPKQHKSVETSVTTIEASSETQEAWPDPIEAIALSGWKLID